MNMKFKISDLKAALRDPKALAEIRKMSPELANMSDEDFAKVTAGLDSRLDIFTDKFGNMSGEDVYELGKQQQENIRQERNRDKNNMTLTAALEALKPLKNYDKLMIQEKLNSGFTLVCADKVGAQTAFKYVFKVKDNLLYFYKLSESTPEHIVLTLEQVNKMIPGLFNIVYEQYISKQDLLFEDVEDNFGNVEENTWNKSEEDIMKMMETTDMMAFGNN